MEMMAWVMTVSGDLNELEDISYTQLSTNSHYNCNISWCNKHQDIRSTMRCLWDNQKSLPSARKNSASNMFYKL